MSLNDLPSEVLDDLVYVLRLAALTEDRTPREQKALDRLAGRVDDQVNRGAQKRTDPATRPPCTYSTDHPKDCVCRGDNRAVVPAGGWSRLSEDVQG